MKKVNAPCKDCERRFLGCHSTCEEYKEFKEFREAYNMDRKAKLDSTNKTYILRYKNPWRT